MFEHLLERLAEGCVLFYCTNDPPSVLSSAWLLCLCRRDWAMLLTCVCDVDSARLANKWHHLSPDASRPYRLHLLAPNASACPSGHVAPATSGGRVAGRSEDGSRARG